MATTFIKDQQVRLNAEVPQGPVVALRMTEEGQFYYLVEWTDAEGSTQQRWFKEEELVAV